MYSEEQFGRELKEVITKGEMDTMEIGKWVFERYFANISDIPYEPFGYMMMILHTMKNGPEFAFTSEQLHMIADDLIAGRFPNMNASDYRQKGTLW